MALPRIVLYDANILYPAPLRDLFIRIAQAGLVQARWTNAIHDEWIRNLLKNSPQLSADRLAQTRSLMNDAVRDCLVTHHEDLIDSLRLPDPDDRHVLAAAIRAKAEAIVTFNLRDFPTEALAGFGIQAIHPDDLLLAVFQQYPEEVCLAFQKQRASLLNPPVTVEELLTTLANQGLTQTVSSLRGCLDLL